MYRACMHGPAPLDLTCMYDSFYDIFEDGQNLPQSMPSLEENDWGTSYSTVRGLGRAVGLPTLE